MRSWTNGSGADSTATVMANLAANSQPLMFTLIKIQLVRWNSLPTASYSIFPCPFKSTWLLTDFPAAVKYNPLGTFSPAVIKHGGLEFSASDSSGFGKSNFDITWSPSPSDVLIPSYQFGGGPNPISPPLGVKQGVLEGMFDGAYVWIYKVLMASPTDANSFGVCLLTMGLVDQIELEAGEVRFKCVDVISQRMQNIPAQLISSESRFHAVDPLVLSTTAAGEDISSVQKLGLNTTQVITGRVLAHVLSPWPTGTFNGGVFVWLAGPLAGMRRAIINSVYDSINGTYIYHLATPFPFDANLYDQGFAFGLPFVTYLPTSPKSSDTFYDGFPYVPLPEDGI